MTIAEQFSAMHWAYKVVFGIGYLAACLGAMVGIALMIYVLAMGGPPSKK